MDKNTFLQLVSQQIASGVVSPEEIVAVCQKLQPQSGSAPAPKRLSATSILYTIGGLVLIIGVGSFVFRFWQELGDTVRVLITLGFAAAAYVGGILLRGDADHGKISRVLFIISGILAPIGAFITLDALSVDYGNFGWSATIAILLTTIYGASLFFIRTVEFAFFITVFGTWTIYAVTGYFLDVSGNTNSLEDTYKYLTLAVGAAYLLIESTLRQENRFGGFLSFCGASGVFGALIALSAWSPTQSVFWEFVSVVAVLGGLSLSSRTGNRTLLKTSALFVFILIIRFTSEYFVDSLGWPIALIFAGIALLAAGYGLVAFSKRNGAVKP